MNISDLKIGKYVVVNDLGASKYSSGMRVIGKVVSVDPCGNSAIISSFPDHNYEITDFNDFELWTKEIADKTESMSESKWGTDERFRELRKKIKEQNEGLKSLVKLNQSNDLQQRKRKEKILQWNDDVKLQFIERVIKNLSPLTAYHIGNAIDVLAVSDSKEDIDKARWYIQRAFEVWDVK